MEDDVNGLGWTVNHCFDGGGLFIELMGGDASIIVVEKLEDGIHLLMKIGRAS